ncbi:MAG TPA: CHAP domain-containing protein [Alphaproteobacteria bacterium]|nr:CHAP domain-containing protein [Alphaproteobacteria bacterium]
MTWWQHAKLVVSFFAFMLLISGPAWAIQCVPYARHISGIDLYGNAWTWWYAADGQYGRGHRPVVGSALVFKKQKHMPDGHVAIVTKVYGPREIAVDHANWAPKHGPKGWVQRNARVIDVSPNNDWSEVRVWYPPIHDFGSKAYPVYGFIYRDGAPSEAGHARSLKADSAS